MIVVYPSLYGTAQVPMVGGKTGGVIVFGGGLALYNWEGILLGALGFSGDSSCADHNISWCVLNAANMDFVSAGPHAAGFEHSDCGCTEK